MWLLDSQRDKKQPLDSYTFLISLHNNSVLAINKQRIKKITFLGKLYSKTGVSAN